MGAIDIPVLNLIFIYALLLIPLSIVLWLRIPMFSTIITAVLRMTVQLLFVGFYLQVVFNVNNFWLTLAWLLIMIIVADFSISRGSGLKVRKMFLSIFVSMTIGTAIPLLFFLAVILRRPNLLDAQFAIPIAGMILGNCLRSNIIGIENFYHSLHKQKKSYEHMLAQGATLREAVKPFLRRAVEKALSPIISYIAIIGLVTLPGMMTGVILGGTDPMTAIKYQLAIMISIFTGTAISVTIAITFSTRNAFGPFSNLDNSIFSNKNK